ncbi:MAG TPA: magnesium transporter [Rudaea sp.]|jgi:magnesium transporter|uniref:magnesium transporter n=1 Tax=Rudaea sp. TaxID=2136325 RepID=UPI002F924B2E
MTVTETRLSERIRKLDTQVARDKLEGLPDAEIAQALAELGPGHAIDILQGFSAARRASIAAATTSGEGEQWLQDWNYPEGSIGRLMETTPAVFRPETTASSVIEAMREVVKRQLITYIFAVDAERRLIGVVTFRELLYASEDAQLMDVMVREPFALNAQSSLVDAMREVVTRHYPVYPVCDSAGRLIGQVRGQVMFEQQAFEISAQAGSMVGVEKEERTSTPWLRALKFRHPWLQLNLLTAFIAAAVVGIFQSTVNQIVLLAVFLPVLSGQCSNTGCQALAVTLRGMTLNEIRAGRANVLLVKEAWLGLLNGLLVGFVAGTAMYIIARMEHNVHALPLALITVVAMALSSVASGIAGAAVPMGLKRIGADPAMASSIFLTTATDVVSMGLFLGMARWLLL